MQAVVGKGQEKPYDYRIDNVGRIEQNDLHLVGLPHEINVLGEFRVVHIVRRLIERL